MRQSRLFTKIQRSFPKDEEAISAKFLIRCGFIDKTMAGVFSFLPLGILVLRKIENIIREEMNAMGGEELLLPVLHPEENWKITGRWNSFGALFKTKGRDGKEMGLGPTHEEIITPLVQKFVGSYKDLPVYVYQIQDKMRDEERPKSGLLRGKEFIMKDFYSFHADQKDLDAYYEKIKKAYFNVFRRTGLNSLIVEASGGSFSKYSHEYQVLADIGEDLIFYCPCGFAQNKEIAKIKEGSPCPKCKKPVKTGKGIEVGNIFKLNTKFSEPFNFKYKDEKGGEKIVYMGCYGIGVGRLLGTIVEVCHDNKGIIWPEEVAPYSVHLLELPGGNAKKIYEALEKEKIGVLYDDRDVSAGEKLVGADLIGIPYRALVSRETKGKIEIKKRGEKKEELTTLPNLIKLLKS